MTWILAQTQADAPSVIQVRSQNVLPAGIGSTIVESLRRFEAELESGALITIDLARSRVRILPIAEGQSG